MLLFDVVDDGLTLVIVVVVGAVGCDVLDVVIDCDIEGIDVPNASLGDCGKTNDDDAEPVVVLVLLDKVVLLVLLVNCEPVVLFVDVVEWCDDNVEWPDPIDN